VIKLNKEVILKKLKESILDKDKIIIISGASLVIQNIINETWDIDLSCDIDYYNLLDWDKKIGALGKEIKFNDVFEISNNLYYPEDIIIIDGYKFMNLEKCLEIKKKLNRDKDRYIIDKLEKLLKD